MLRLRHITTFVLALFVACLLAVPSWAADGSTVVLDYRPTANPVADRTVHIDVNKLDSDTHEFVVGAHLQIIDKETGEIKADWVSNGSTQASARELDVDRNYILHEVEAPEGYEKAEDVEFILRSVNFETKGEVISGAETSDGKTNAEFNNVSGDIETQAFVISLYDKAVPGEQTVTKTVERNNENQTQKENTDQNSTSKGNSTTAGSTATKTTTTTNTLSGGTANNTASGGGSLTKTSDGTSYVPIILIAMIGIGNIALAINKRKKG